MLGRKAAKLPSFLTVTSPFIPFYHTLCFLLFIGCLGLLCSVEPKEGEEKDGEEKGREEKEGGRIKGMNYDTLMPKDIEPYLNGRS